VKARNRFVCVALAACCATAPSGADSIARIGVDGSSSNPTVVVRERSPIFYFSSTWTAIVGTAAVTHTAVAFELKLALSSAQLTAGPTFWYTAEMVSVWNTADHIIRRALDSSVTLAEGATYFWSVTLYNNTETTSTGTLRITATDFFVTDRSAIALKSLKDAEVKVDRNNPFCPACGETTKFRYLVRTKDARIKLHVFTISGKHVATLAEHLAIKDVLYTREWDGRDAAGRPVPEGMYVVTIVAGDAPLLGLVPASQSMSKHIGVIGRR